MLLWVTISFKYDDVKNEVLTDFDVNKLLMKTYMTYCIYTRKNLLECN